MKIITCVLCVFMYGCTIPPVAPGTELTKYKYIGRFKGYDIYKINTEYETIYFAEGATITIRRTKQNPAITITSEVENNEK